MGLVYFIKINGLCVLLNSTPDATHVTGDSGGLRGRRRTNSHPNLNEFNDDELHMLATDNGSSNESCISHQPHASCLFDRNLRDLKS